LNHPLQDHNNNRLQPGTAGCVTDNHSLEIVDTNPVLLNSAAASNTSNQSGRLANDSLNEQNTKSATLQLCVFNNSNVLISTKRRKEQRHQEIVDENDNVGFLLASKAIVQIIINPFVGPITKR